MKQHHIKGILAIPIILLIAIVVFLQFNNNGAGEASETQLNDSAIQTTSQFQIDSDKLDSSIQLLDSLKPVVENTIEKIRHYEKLRREYEQRVSAVIAAPQRNDTEINMLKKKLADANSQIAKLNSELKTIRGDRRSYPPGKIPDTVFIQPKSNLPDDNSLFIDLNEKGIKAPENLTIYLIPYTRKVKKLMTYEASCPENVIQKSEWYKVAKPYKGLYFFSNVEPGKYLIKICTYYGNYKIINKGAGTYSTKMEMAPPVQ